ncbi:hypothetical protein D9623_33900 (plasmid) [Azospirillum brasilense]|uniref:Uncharacterized protein n=2 Tax=root TaxID=1 RepID=A0A4D8R124_AZOBR|nr:MULTISPECIES: hypothetical protein [Azospirillum]MDW7555437.1 hypothetical protein [Azospirillum brasilense]MDW7595155.1 hypothetical protein [Azospirillum brasilense]MDW7630308.1 hypothetical protein [Azospirillum brasilense]MDX5949676.1 hypothetical protein [Azospirillum brasilense]QCO12899.1 hypothetical protein D3868_28230 [Azospirillum brasilense]
MTYTPGPHRFVEFRCGDGRDGFAILSDNPEVGRGYGVAWIEECQLPNAKHDGPLFAAATELLEALVEVVRISDRKHEAWDRARAAIAKATSA